MIFREAQIADIEQMQVIRFAVKENILSNPALVTYKDYVTYLTERGKGWICEVNEIVVGFAIADLKENNIWALFIHPQFEGKGIGKQLHQLMVDWYFTNTKEKVWLSTAPHTRAAIFYKKRGRQEKGKTKSGELKFEMTFVDWHRINNFK